MELWTVWLIVAIVLIIIEVLSLTMWSLCMAIGALGALVCALTGLPLVVQLVVMAIVAMIALVMILPRFRRWHNQSASARTGVEAMLGQRAILTEAIYPDTPGRARLDGSSWQVTAPGYAGVIPAGTEVVVTGYDSIILQVKPIK